MHARGCCAKIEQPTFRLINMPARGRSAPPERGHLRDRSISRDLGGHEPDPPSNVQARVVEDGILVTWDPSPIIPGAFDPGASPPIGFYKLTLWDAEGQTLYSWGPVDEGSQPETAHLVPFRRQDFVLGASGLALEGFGDGTFYISMDAYSYAPEEAAGYGLECEAQDPEEGIWIVIKEGQARIEKP